MISKRAYQRWQWSYQLSPVSWRHVCFLRALLFTGTLVGAHKQYRVFVVVLILLCFWLRRCHNYLTSLWYRVGLGWSRVEIWNSSTWETLARWIFYHCLTQWNTPSPIRTQDLPSRIIFQRVFLFGKTFSLSFSLSVFLSLYLECQSFRKFSTLTS